MDFVVFRHGGVSSEINTRVPEKLNPTSQSESSYFNPAADAEFYSTYMQTFNT